MLVLVWTRSVAPSAVHEHTLHTGSEAGGSSGRLVVIDRLRSVMSNVSTSLTRFSCSGVRRHVGFNVFVQRLPSTAAAQPSAQSEQ